MINIKTKNCKFCLEEFLAEGLIGYCSDKCRHQAMYKRRKIKEILSLESGRIHGRTLQEDRYKRYKDNAKKREISFNLSFEEFCRYWQLSCTYCKQPIITIGLDRKNNDKGYQLDNITPCCSECNKMKRGMFYIQFIEHCKKVANNF